CRAAQGRHGHQRGAGRLSEGRTQVEDVRVIFRALPTYDNAMHYGSPLAFGPDGMLFVTPRERFDVEIRKEAQARDNHLGKVLRIRPDGSVPPDNPFATKQGAEEAVWTLGHRNTQAMAFDPQGRLWVIEHGAQGGDELNLVQKGKNYGWPVAGYGEH